MSISQKNSRSRYAIFASAAVVSASLAIGMTPGPAAAQFYGYSSYGYPGPVYNYSAPYAYPYGGGYGSPEQYGGHRYWREGHWNRDDWRHGDSQADHGREWNRAEPSGQGRQWNGSEPGRGQSGSSQGHAAAVPSGAGGNHGNSSAGQGGAKPGGSWLAEHAR
jgi:hypothetical protein